MSMYMSISRESSLFSYENRDLSSSPQFVDLLAQLFHQIHSLVSSLPIPCVDYLWRVSNTWSLVDFMDLHQRKLAIQRTKVVITCLSYFFISIRSNTHLGFWEFGHLILDFSRLHLLEVPRWLDSGIRAPLWLLDMIRCKNSALSMKIETFMVWNHWFVEAKYLFHRGEPTISRSLNLVFEIGFVLDPNEFSLINNLIISWFRVHN